MAEPVTEKSGEEENELLLDDSQLRGNEFFVMDSDELLWRQVHPNHVQHEGIVDGSAFAEIVQRVAMQGVPTSRDEVSVSRQSRVTAQFAHEDWIAREKPSHGTFAISVSEVYEVGGRVIDDSACLGSADVPGHAIADLRPITQSPNFKRMKLKTAQSTLAAYATYRGKQFPVD